MPVPTLVAFVFCLGSAFVAQALEAPVSAQQTAGALLDALQANDLAAAESHCLDPATFAALSRRPQPADEMHARQRGFLRQLAREFQLGVRLERLELKDVLLLPAGVKTRREVVMAVFHLGLVVPDGDPARPAVTPLLFIQADGGWKFFARD